MQKITNRTLHTPSGAAFVQVVENENGIVTLEYFSEGKSHMPFAPFTARVMREDAYAKLVKNDLQTGKANKQEKDPRQDKKVRKQADEHPARKVTDGEKVMGYKPDGDYDFLDTRQHKATKNSVTKQAKKPVGKHKGAADIQEDISIDTKYTWGAIEEALFSAGLDESQIRNVKMNLFGDEAEIPGIGESRLFKEAPEDFQDSEEQYPVDMDIDAVDDALGTSEHNNEVYVGQNQSDTFDKLVNLSKEEFNGLSQLKRGTRLKQVRIQDGEVVKVVPTTVLGTFVEGDTLYAKVKVGAKQMKVKMATKGKVLLKKGRRTEILYSVRKL